jgi:hypothetical protein
VKAAFEQPSIGDIHQIRFQVRDYRLRFLRRESFAGKILPS